MNNTLEELTTDSLKVILTKYKKDVVLNKFYNGHESIKYYKDILTIENIEEAYFCEKRVDLDHKKLDKIVIEQTENIIINDVNLSHHLCAEVNGVYIISKLGKQHDLKVFKEDNGCTIKLEINKYGIMYNNSYTNMEDEVFARTVCLCLDQMLNDVGYMWFSIVYEVNYRDDKDNSVIKCFKYNFDMGKRIKAKNDIEWVLGYWQGLRNVVRTKSVVKCKMCEYNNVCNVGI